MEYTRMVHQLQNIVERANEGKHRIRHMDAEAIKDALERFDEDIPSGKPKMGFHVPKEV